MSSRSQGSSGSKSRSAVFLDRDGVICENRPDFVKSWGEFVFIPGAADAVSRLNRAGFLVVVVTNQSGVGRGLFTEDDLEELHGRMIESLSGQNASLDAVYFCPHTDHDNCRCRKPRPGMLEQAGADLGIDFESSFLVGDSLRDLQAADAVGVTGIMVRTGLGAEQQDLLRASLPSAHVVDDISDAVDLVLSVAESSKRAGNSTDG